MPSLRIEGIGAWAAGLPDWPSMAAYARGEQDRLSDAPRRPAPSLLPANERRRAPDSVLLALQVAQEACVAAQRSPRDLPSIFTSTHGDLAITDYMCQTLASAPTEMSPTKFHNSVHNAAAGYWTIGTGCHQPATAISAYTGSFAQGLLEAALQLAAGAEAVLLVAYDGPSVGPLTGISRSEGLLGLALVLSLAPEHSDSPRVTLHWHDRTVTAATPGPLRTALQANAMSAALILAEALASTDSRCELPAGPEQCLQIETSQ
ncbi:beta-ketoacyl synthase chain length factor [Pseudomarimonas arenosa]|uniref:Beta-ketoacyl synthase chain length factor n=1 Tax=Pseudomarimonas arenosa TaxID=2774145 RepID=A0AAW3ZKH7_9GAMM|nr:beta-ketoacyl synthase chain length factor [Pseudomarimonas arenosa]MBD8525415.1 beta-ketoacyl synthase chain length factor [Pseudomarimonas arenosa]